MEEATGSSSRAAEQKTGDVAISTPKAEAIVTTTQNLTDGGDDSSEDSKSCISKDGTPRGEEGEGSASTPALIQMPPNEDYPPQTAAVANTNPMDPPPVDPETNINPALAVRRHLGARLIHGVSNLGGDTRFALFAKAFWIFGQIITFIVVLGISSRQDCDRPLRIFLSVEVARIAIAWPLSFYSTLMPPRPRASEADTPESAARREARRVIGNPVWDSRVRLASDVTTVLGLVFFGMGNVWFWGSHTCKSTAPTLYWGSLVGLITGYIYAAEILLIVLAVVFFLPAVVLLMNAFGIGRKTHDIGPLHKDDIAKLPLVLYVPKLDAPIASPVDQPEVTPNNPIPDPVTVPNHEPALTPATNVTTPARKHRGRRLIRLFWSSSRSTTAPEKSRDSNQGFVNTPWPLHPLPANLSTCPICLTDFEAPPPFAENETRTYTEADFEPLRLLPCGHCLHRDCVDPWLATSGRCPVCQAPVKSDKAAKRNRSSTAASRRDEEAPPP